MKKRKVKLIQTSKITIKFILSQYIKDNIKIKYIDNSILASIFKGTTNDFSLEINQEYSKNNNDNNNLNKRINLRIGDINKKYKKEIIIFK